MNGMESPSSNLNNCPPGYELRTVDSKAGLFDNLFAVGSNQSPTAECVATPSETTGDPCENYRPFLTANEIISINCGRHPITIPDSDSFDGTIPPVIIEVNGSTFFTFPSNRLTTKAENDDERPNPVAPWYRTTSHSPPVETTTDEETSHSPPVETTTDEELETNSTTPPPPVENKNNHKETTIDSADLVTNGRGGLLSV